MREFLRYLFVVAAMLMVVVGDVWGQTYNGGTWYSLYNTNSNGYTLSTIDSEELATFTPVKTYEKNLIFDAKKQLGGANSLRIAPIVNGEQQDKIFEDNLTTSYKEYSATVTNPNSNPIKFYTVTGATLKKYFKNIKLPMASHILLNDDTDNGKKYGVSEITKREVNLAIAEGQSDANKYYTIKFRSFLASGNITLESSDSQFHFGFDGNGNKITSVSLGTQNNYFAKIGGGASKSSTNVGDQRNVDEYAVHVYFSPSVQYNANARSTTITITDGVNTAYVYLTAPVIPTYYFKAEAIAEPTTGGVATAKFVNGANIYSLVAPSVGTNSMSADVTFEATATGNSVFEGWKKPSEDAYYKQGAATYRFVETITSNVLDPRTMASQKTYRAIFSERFTAKIETNDISGLKVGASATAVYSFVNTSADVPSVDENADFHYVITHRPDNTTKNGSADASKVVSLPCSPSPGLANCGSCSGCFSLHPRVLGAESRSAVDSDSPRFIPECADQRVLCRR